MTRSQPSPRSARRWSRPLAPRRVALAHSGTQSYVYLMVKGGGFIGNVQFPVHDINHILDLSIPEDEAGAGPAVAANRAALEAYAREHLAVGDGSRSWKLDFGIDRALLSVGGVYAVLEFRVAERFETFPTQVEVSYDGIIHAYPERNARIFVKTQRGWGPFRRAPEEGRTFTVDNSTQTFRVEEDTVGRDVLGTLTVLGRRTVKRARGLVRRFVPTRR